MTNLNWESVIEEDQESTPVVFLDNRRQIARWSEYRFLYAAVVLLSDMEHGIKMWSSWLVPRVGQFSTD